MAKEDPLFHFYLEAANDPANNYGTWNNYGDWLLSKPAALEDDEIVNVNLDDNEIVYRRVCEYNGIPYAFDYSIRWDREGVYSFADIDSLIRVYPKEITKIIYTEEM